MGILELNIMSHATLLRVVILDNDFISHDSSSRPSAVHSSITIVYAHQSHQSSREFRGRKRIINGVLKLKVSINHREPEHVPHLPVQAEQRRS
jgi:hypothetical protein